VPDIPAVGGLSRNPVLTVLFTRVLYGMSFDSSNMERGGFYHERYMGLLLAEYIHEKLVKESLSGIS
jgi:hypothetical protein